MSWGTGGTGARIRRGENEQEENADTIYISKYLTQPFCRRFAPRRRWSETVTQYLEMVDAVEMRYDLLDDGKVKYDDVIDGLVLDSETMIREGMEIKDLFRKVNDHLFDECQKALEGFEPLEVERFHDLYGGIVEATKRHSKSIKRAKEIKEAIWAAYEFMLVENGEEIAEQWESDLEKIGGDTVHKIKQLKESTKRVKIPTSQGATWGMPRVTEKGRKEGIESNVRTEGVSLRTKGQKDKNYKSGGELFKEVRLQRKQEVENMASLSTQLDWDIIDYYLRTADEGDYTPARFKATVDEHILGIFKRGTGYEDTVETEAAGGLDEREGERGMAEALGNEVGRTYDEFYNDIDGDSVNPRTMVKEASRRASSRLWRDIEEGVVIKQGGMVPSPSEKKSEAPRSPTNPMKFDQKLSRSLNEASLKALRRQSTPNESLILQYIFAGASPNLSLDDLLKAIQEREEVERRVSEAESWEIQVPFYFRDEPVYKKAVREGKSLKECEQLYKDWNEAREKSLELEEARKHRQRNIKPWENCPSELRRLFEETEGLEGDAKKEQIREILDSDYTLESTPFRNGLTALHVASVRGDTDIIVVLMERGGKERKDRWGRWPRDYTRDRNILRELGMLRTTQPLCELRSTLKRRVMQKVKYLVSGRGGESGIAEDYDFINKTLYVMWDGSDDKVQVPIHMCALRKCLIDSEPQMKLFEDISARVHALRNRLCRESAIRVAEAVLYEATEYAFDFITHFQEDVWNDIITETVGEMAISEASEDMAEAIAEQKRRDSN